MVSVILLLIAVGFPEPAYANPKNYELELSKDADVLTKKDKEPVKISFTQNIPILKGKYVTIEIKPGKSNSTIREEKIKRERLAQMRKLRAQRLEHDRIQTSISSSRISSGNNDWYSIIPLAANKYHVSANILYAIMKCESGGNPNAQNASGASGLFQFMPSTWRSTPYGGYSIWNGEKQCYAAAWMLSVGRREEWVC